MAVRKLSLAPRGWLLPGRGTPQGTEKRVAAAPPSTHRKPVAADSVSGHHHIPLSQVQNCPCLPRLR